MIVNTGAFMPLLSLIKILKISLLCYFKQKIMPCKIMLLLQSERRTM